MTEKVIFNQENIRRCLTRLAHEILERNRGAQDLVFIGLRTRGVPLARRLAAAIKAFEGVEVPIGALDITLYRDDLSLKDRAVLYRTDIPVDIVGKGIILVDDVLYTGRSIRAALDALTDLGRPRFVQLAVLVDRGHRDLPIRPDYVGRNIPTARIERVQVKVTEVDGVDQVVIIDQPEIPEHLLHGLPVGSKGRQTEATR